MAILADDDHHHHSSLLLHSNHHHKRGTIWTALAHIITAVIGSGVLSLAWSMSQLGWIAGPLTMLAFALVTITSAFLLINCYSSPDPDNGLHCTNGSYLDAVSRILGEKSRWACGIIVHVNFIKTSIVYTITSSISMRAIQRSNCYHTEGHTAACEYGSSYYILMFGIVQVIVSQIPDFRNITWLSIVAAIMSFTYSTIGSALGLAKVIENGEIKGSIGGITAPAPEKIMSIAQALGDIAFAFPFSLVFLEIMDTLKSSPPERVVMKKASITAVCITTFFYMCCGGFGYAAFGNSTPGNLLTGFGFYEPFWLVDFANACVVLHLVGGYQVFSQPLYASIEQWFAKKFPDSRFVHDDLKHVPALRLNLFRLCFRTAYVGFTTAFAMLFPYFNQIVGLAGAITFWPVIVYFPVEMYLAQKKIGTWTSKSIVLRIYSSFMLLVIIFAFVGSIKGLITARFG